MACSRQAHWEVTGAKIDSGNLKSLHDLTGACEEYSIDQMQKLAEGGCHPSTERTKHGRATVAVADLKNQRYEPTGLTPAVSPPQGAGNELKQIQPIARSLKQVVLWIGANSGGVSKTTLAIHLAYEMAQHGANVAILDLDTNVSMSQFTGLSKAPVAGDTLAYVLSEHFEGDWPLASPDWGSLPGTIEICRGGPVMAEAATELASRKRREYLLSDRLNDYPLPHDLVILDCPATLSHLSDIALVSATHLLIPLEPTPKSLSGCDVLLKWYRVNCRALRLNPEPKILGVIPVRYDASSATQRDYNARLPILLGELGIHCFPPVRFSQEFINTSARGLPLQLHRPSHKACADFIPLSESLAALLEGESNG